MVQIHPRLSLAAVKIAQADVGDARLVYWNDELVAVVTRRGPVHEHLEAQWFIEASFGLDTHCESTFSSLEELTAFIADRCGVGGSSA